MLTYWSQPALLPECPRPTFPSDRVLLGSDWTALPYSTCYFVFTTNEMLSQRQILTYTELQREGFLPSGLFERLLARSCTWAQNTTPDAIQRMEGKLFKNVAVVSYGAQLLRLMLREDINCIEMDVEGQSPLGAFHRVQDQILVIIAECMQSLVVFAALEIPTSGLAYFYLIEDC